MKQKGFTLIEVMLIATIISTLTAIAIPTYLDYSTRAKVSDGIQTAHPAMLASDEYYRIYNSFPANNQEAGIEPPAFYESPIVDRLEILPGGIVEVTFRLPTLLNKKIRYTADISTQSITWVCTSDIPNNLVPASCR